MAVWRVQIRASNQSGTDDLYFVIMTVYNFYAFYAEQSKGSRDLTDLAEVFKLFVGVSPSVNYL